jgi:hypothetical protein
VADDPARIDDERDPAAFLDLAEDGEAHRLAAIAGLELVPVVGGGREHDGTVGPERLFELGELEDVCVANAERDDDPGAAVLREREWEALLALHERVGGEEWRGCSGEVAHDRDVKPGPTVSSSSLRTIFMSFFRTTSVRWPHGS